MSQAALGELAPASRRDGGSFRDPSGYVFHRDGDVYRALSDAAYADFAELHASGLLRTLQDQRLIVSSEEVRDPGLLQSLAEENPGFRHFVRHERITPITYPYEWTVSMLGDAGRHTLVLQRMLVKAGWSLKDATAYNIQFVAGRPVFIDITSIERSQRLDV